jgi:hypothetical protein
LGNGFQKTVQVTTHQEVGESPAEVAPEIADAISGELRRVPVLIVAPPSLIVIALLGCGTIEVRLPHLRATASPPWRDLLAFASFRPYNL